jgi:hypothetical protein
MDTHAEASVCQGHLQAPGANLPVKLDFRGANLRVKLDLRGANLRMKLDLTVRVTDVYKKAHGRWHLIHEHVSVPLDLTTDKPDLSSKP